MSQRIRSKQRGRWCDFCPPKTARATWRCFGWVKCSCDEHKPLLDEIDASERTKDYHQQYDRY